MIRATVSAILSFHWWVWVDVIEFYFFPLLFLVEKRAQVTIVLLVITGRSDHALQMVFDFNVEPASKRICEARWSKDLGSPSTKLSLGMFQY